VDALTILLSVYSKHNSNTIKQNFIHKSD